MTIRYSKPYLSIPEQVDLLIQRGMIITERSASEQILSRIGYYRLSAYWYPFRTRTTSPTHGEPSTIEDKFVSGTTLRTAHNLYIFDKKLRIHFLDALERIEISLRTTIALQIAKHDPWAHLKPQYLHGNFTKKPKHGSTETRYDVWLRKLDDTLEKSKEDFVKHFKAKYPKDKPPLWIAVELWDFGMLSHFYEGCAHKDKVDMAANYGVSDPIAFGTWIRCLNDVRNICAHHSRLWNRPLINQPTILPKESIPLLSHIIGSPHSQKRLYTALAITKYLLRTIHPQSTWGLFLQEHMSTFPTHPSISIQQSGFPIDWLEKDLWKN